MKMISKEIVNGKSVITVSKPFFIFWQKEIKYEAQKELPKGYWTWLEMPNMTIVDDYTSFQLSAWNRIKDIRL